MANRKKRSKRPSATQEETSARSSQRRRILIAAVSLALVAFVLDLTIALRLGSVGAVDQYDVLFNADTVARIECMVENECGGRSSFSHPNLAVFLNPPVQTTAWILKHTVFFGRSEAEIRRAIALVICPLASALKAPAVFLLFLLLGLTVTQAGLLALLNIVTFSQLVFGSIPEGFALSGLLLALAYLLAVHSMRSNYRRLWPWIVLGFLTTGITVTNLVIVVILFVTARMYTKMAGAKIILHTAFLVAAVVIPTAILPQLVKGTYHLREVSLDGGSDYTARWMQTDRAVERALETPVTWAHTFASPPPGTARNNRAIRERSKYPFRFTLSPPRVYACRDPLSLSLLLLLVMGTLYYRYAPRIAQWTCGASLTIVAFNWALHSIWGVDLFLYSQHWQLSLLVLVAGPLFTDKPSVRKIAVYAVIALTLAAVAQNGVTLSAMLAKLESVGP